MAVKVTIQCDVPSCKNETHLDATHKHLTEVKEELEVLLGSWFCMEGHRAHICPSCTSKVTKELEKFTIIKRECIMSRTNHHFAQKHLHNGEDFSGKYKCNKKYGNSYGTEGRSRADKERRKDDKNECEEGISSFFEETLDIVEDVIDVFEDFKNLEGK